MPWRWTAPSKSTDFLWGCFYRLVPSNTSCFNMPDLPYLSVFGCRALFTEPPLTWDFALPIRAAFWDSFRIWTFQCWTLKIQLLLQGWLHLLASQSDPVPVLHCPSPSNCVDTGCTSQATLSATTRPILPKAWALATSLLLEFPFPARQLRPALAALPIPSLTLPSTALVCYSLTFPLFLPTS